MVKIVIGDRDRLSLDVILGILRKACAKAGIPAELKRREFYESPGEKKRRKKRAAIRERIKNQAKNDSER